MPPSRASPWPRYGRRWRTAGTASRTRTRTRTGRSWSTGSIVSAAPTAMPRRSTSPPRASSTSPWRAIELWRLRGEDGKAPGMIGWWPAKATTFVDNHDTGSTQHLWPFPSDKDTPTSSPTPATHASSTTISSTGVSRMRSSASCQSETGRGSTRRGGAVAGSCRVEKGRCCQRWKPREGNLRMCPWPSVFRASLFTPVKKKYHRSRRIV
uniref:1,4-alpha-D-glucan glucanohydrolase n=1 Tax=Oryza glumipatula TaxID=40148 RepID=A0A0D9Y8C5_9ORYZ